MANNFTGKNAANGQVANVLSSIYTCPASTTAYRPCITLYNNNAATQTIVLYYLPSVGTARKLRQYILATDESAVYDERMHLNAGDAIQAVTTDATSVDYTVSLVEEA